MSDLPIIMTSAGAQPTPPKTLLAKLINKVSAQVPGYTANLPPGLITDLASTATGAIALIDQAMVDLINSVTPYGANIPVLNELGVIYGVPHGVGSNTSVNVVFMGSPGFIIPRGFVVSDGNYQYAVQNNYIIPASGQSEPAYCLALVEGQWAVPAGTVTQIITSVPDTIKLTVTNLTEGVPGLEAQSVSDYRTQVWRAGMFASQGTPDFVKATVGNVDGVHPRLVSYRQVALGRWALIVGGGDPYIVAKAIYESVPDISILTTDVNNPSGYVPDSVTVTIEDYPDDYIVSWLVPTSQSVSVILTWNTIGYNYVDPASVSRLGVPAVVDYINGIYVGKPVSIYRIQSVFQEAIISIVNPNQLSLIDVKVAIDGELVQPDPNTGLISGDFYKYFTTDASAVIVQHYENDEGEMNG